MEGNIGNPGPSSSTNNLFHPINTAPSSSTRSRSAMGGNLGDPTPNSDMAFNRNRSKSLMSYPSGIEAQTNNQTESPKTKSNSEGMKTNITITVCFVVGVYGVIINKTGSLGMF